MHQARWSAPIRRAARGLSSRLGRHHRPRPTPGHPAQPRPNRMAGFQSPSRRQTGLHPQPRPGRTPVTMAPQPLRRPLSRQERRRCARIQPRQDPVRRYGVAAARSILLRLPGTCIRIYPVRSPTRSHWNAARASAHRSRLRRTPGLAPPRCWRQCSPAAQVQPSVALRRSNLGNPRLRVLGWKRQVTPPLESTRKQSRLPEAISHRLPPRPRCSRRTPATLPMAQGQLRRPSPRTGHSRAAAYWPTCLQPGSRRSPASPTPLNRRFPLARPSAPPS